VTSKPLELDPALHEQIKAHCADGDKLVMNTLELQQAFITALLKEAPAAWDRIEIHYEHFEWQGKTFEKYISNTIRSGQATELPLSLEMLDLLVELQRHPPQGQADKWTWLEFTLDNSGRYAFNYQYGTPPLTAKSLKYAS